MAHQKRESCESKKRAQMAHQKRESCESKKRAQINKSHEIPKERPFATFQ